jgi:hypothetical protein
MSQGTPAKTMDRRRRAGDRAIVEGDIMVTAVGEHYAIGRLKADRGTQEHLRWQQNRAAALQQACALAGAKHQVFLYPKADRPDHLVFDCAAVSKCPRHHAPTVAITPPPANGRH